MAARSRIKGKGKSLYRCFKGTVSIFCGLGGLALQLPAQCKLRKHVQEGCVYSWGNNWVISSISVQHTRVWARSLGLDSIFLSFMLWRKGRKDVILGLYLSKIVRSEEALGRESQALPKKSQGVTHAHTYSLSAAGWKAHDKKMKNSGGSRVRAAESRSQLLNNTAVTPCPSLHAHSSTRTTDIQHKEENVPQPQPEAHLGWATSPFWPWVPEASMLFPFLLSLGMQQTPLASTDPGLGFACWSVVCSQKSRGCGMEVWPIPSAGHHLN